MDIDSAPGQGCRFTLSLPIEHNIQPVQSDPKLDDRQSKIRVLLADDHALFRDGMARLCKREHDITVVGHSESGRDAVIMAEKLKPNVILMDVNMEPMNGIDATAAILKENPSICIIGLSMYEDEPTIQAMRQAGAVDYKSKSSSARELIAAIRACQHSSIDETISQAIGQPSL